MKFYDGLLGHDLDIYFNSHGHRCKELKDLDFHNYFLFAGDNVALDYSKPVEETYPHIISKKLNADYYNLSIFNGGLDALKLNIISWFTRFKHKPKAVIVSNEFVNSLLTSDSNVGDICVLDYQNNDVQDFSHYANLNGHFNAKRELTDRQITHVVTSPIYQISLPGKAPAFTNVRTIHNIEWTGNLYDHEGIAKCFLDSYLTNKRRIIP